MYSVFGFAGEAKLAFGLYQGYNARMTDGKFLLFSREVCPLCDDAAALLDGSGIAWAERDIADDINWLTRYRTRIPVLRNDATGAELDWPFDATRLQEFIDAK